MINDLRNDMNKLMASGKPSGIFSNNHAEGYRIPYPTKNHPKPLHPKRKGQSFYYNIYLASI